MKAAPFEYHSPATVDEVVSLMSEHQEAELLAGNQSLAIQMSNRLATPEHLIDLNSVESLSYIEEEGDEIEIGAMVTHTDICESDVLDRSVPILTEAAAEIAGPSVRNRGTLGGSLGEADPAGNYPTVLTALDAMITVAGPDGSRDVPIRDFHVAYMMTDTQEGELIRSVTVSTDEFPLSRTGTAFHEIKRVPHTWPKLSAAGVVRVDEPDADEPTVEEARLTFANAADVPLRVDDAESAVEGTSLTEDALQEAADAAMDAADPASEMQADADYKEEQVGVFARRALQSAYDRAFAE